MLVKTRKNKHYTSILMTEVSESAFIEAKKVYDNLSGTVVFRFTDKAHKDFLSLYSLSLVGAEEGEYSILGTTYNLIRNVDHSRTDRYSLIGFYNEDTERYEEFTPVSTDIFALAVLEQSFTNLTGLYLYVGLQGGCSNAS